MINMNFLDLMKTKVSQHPFLLFNQELEINCNKLQEFQSKNIQNLQQIIDKRQDKLTNCISQINQISQEEVVFYENSDNITNLQNAFVQQKQDFSLLEIFQQLKTDEFLNELTKTVVSKKNQLENILIQQENIEIKIHDLLKKKQNVIIQETHAEKQQVVDLYQDQNNESRPEPRTIQIQDQINL